MKREHNLYPLQAEKVAERSLPLDAEHLRRLASDVSAMTDALCELRAGGRGVTPQVKNIQLCSCKSDVAGGGPRQEHPEQAWRGGCQRGAGGEQVREEIVDSERETSAFSTGWRSRASSSLPPPCQDD